MKTSILGLIRHLLTFGGGFIVGKGYLDEASMTEVVGGAMTIIGAVWSVYEKLQTEKTEEPVE